jgi:hypothetical protein
MKCSRCKLRAYCSKECQTADWSLHKAPCKLVGLGGGQMGGGVEGACIVREDWDLGGGGEGQCHRMVCCVLLLTNPAALLSRAANGACV